MNILQKIMDFSSQRTARPEWTSTVEVLDRKLIDGSTGSSVLMHRRNRDGSVSYRKPTDEEMLEHLRTWEV